MELKLSALEHQILTALEAVHGPGRKQWNGGWAFRELCDYTCAGEREVSHTIRKLTNAGWVVGRYIDGLSNDLDNWRFYSIRNKRQEPA